MYEFEQRIQIALEEIDFMIRRTKWQLDELRKKIVKPGRLDLKSRGRNFYYYLVVRDEDD